MGKDSFFGGNLLGQESWALRGENDARLRALETKVITTGMVASEAWTVFTPTVTFGATVASIVGDSRWVRVGRLVTVNYAFRITNMNAGTGLFRITTPVPFHPITTPVQSYTNVLGIGSCMDRSTAAIYYFAARQEGTTQVTYSTLVAPTAAITDAAPFAVTGGADAVGDEYYGTITYEAAT